jgi:hypothetical protein
MRFIDLFQVFPLSPVPHNLKVIGSNPIPATKFGLVVQPHRKPPFGAAFAFLPARYDEACHRKWYRYIEFFR